MSSPQKPIIVVYSDDSAVRQAIVAALGKKVAGDLPEHQIEELKDDNQQLEHQIEELKDDNRMCSIYRITDRRTGELLYIGKDKSQL